VASISKVPPSAGAEQKSMPSKQRAESKQEKVLSLCFGMLTAPF